MQAKRFSLLSRLAILVFGVTAIVGHVNAQASLTSSSDHLADTASSEQAKKSPQQEPRKRSVKVLAVDSNGVPSIVAVGNRIARVERYEDYSFRVLVDSPGAHTIKDFIGGTDDALVIRGITRLISKFDKRLHLAKYSGGQKALEPDPEEDEWEVMGWFFTFSLDTSPMIGGGLDAVAAYIETLTTPPACHSRCVAECRAFLDSAKDSFCTTAGAIGAILCLPGAALSIVCGGAGAVSCFAAVAAVREWGCPLDCTEQCALR